MRMRQVCTGLRVHWYTLSKQSGDVCRALPTITRRRVLRAFKHEAEAGDRASHPFPWWLYWSNSDTLCWELWITSSSFNRDNNSASASASWKWYTVYNQSGGGGEGVQVH